jgi:Spy/CpxP family protein refolding chaperone
LPAFIAASAVMFGVAHAQGPGCGPDGMPGMKGRQDAARRHDGIRRSRRTASDPVQGRTQAHRSAGTALAGLADKVKAEAGKGMQAMRERMQGDKPVTAPERMAQMQAMMKERLAAMDSVHESFNRLYAALTPEQKARPTSISAWPVGIRGRGRGGPPQGQGGPAAPEAKG